MARESKRHFTIMVIPHSERSVRSFRVPVAYLEAGLAVLGLAGLALLIFANSYQRMTTNMTELRQLRQLTSDQRQQLDVLSKETETVQDSLKQLEQLDQQVRAMMKLAPKSMQPTSQVQSGGQGKASDLLGLAPIEPNYRPNERDAARIAAAGTASLGSLETSGLIASLDTKNTDAGISRGDLELSTQTLALLEQAKQEIETRQASLTQLQTDVAAQLKYLAAKPSGWPVYGPITSGFGYRSNPYGWGTEFHPGVDIAAPYGSEVRATGDGVVTQAGWDGGYGKLVTIDHGYGFVTMYGHNSKLLVDVGQHVKKGQVIAYVGMTGRTTGPHVHYEVHVNGALVSPLKYLAD